MTAAALLAAAGGQSPLMGFVPIVLMLGIFYVLLFLPMRRRQKALQKLIEGLKRGDKVITNGGIHGEVAEVQDGLLQLKIAPNVKIKIAKSAIAGLEGDPEAEKKP